jgi:hypothetical protein
VGLVGHDPDGSASLTLDESDECIELLEGEVLIVYIRACARARAMMRVRALDWVRGTVEF